MSAELQNFKRSSRSKSCSMHTIDADTLESIILSDIQYHAQTAITHGKRLTDRLLSYSGQERQSEKNAQDKALREAKSRMEFIEEASKRLFEEKISGNVPDSLFRELFADYERELSELEIKYDGLKQSLQEASDTETAVQNWMKLIKQCVSIDRLDRATAFRLIDQVSIHEQTHERGRKEQSIQVKYNFAEALC